MLNSPGEETRSYIAQPTILKTARKPGGCAPRKASNSSAYRARQALRYNAASRRASRAFIAPPASANLRARTGATLRVLRGALAGLLRSTDTDSAFPRQAAVQSASHAPDARSHRTMSRDRAG